ncbi:tRNA (adenosine(37)-N6)-threonylcarbamoyltransferase complex dimerization subunit type 1 TsaB [bacterium]|nr:tRNA (adenosine(37)-N6)-threonylcarbamoyltransferase complex dimerization subunit type 1 TsaB [bacterium]
MILGINTCTQKIEICLIWDGKVEYNSSLHQKNDSEFILNSLNQILDKIGKTVFDIKKIVCVKGPGSFTAVRIGVIIANTLKSQTNCELFEIDTLNYLNYFCGSEEKLLLSAGGSEFYRLINGEIKLLNFKEIPNQKYLAEVSKKQIEKLDLNFEFNPIEYNLDVFLKAFIGGNVNLKDCEQITPNYVKEANIDLSGFSNKTKNKKGYFMVLMSFILCFLMTPLIISLYETEVGQIQTYAAKKEFMEQKLVKKNLSTQIFDNKAWHGKNISENLTLDANFKQQIVNQTVQTLKSNDLIDNPLRQCDNFDFLDTTVCEEQDDLNYAYTVPLFNHGSSNTDCNKFDLRNGEDSIDGDCAFNKLSLSESDFIPLFSDQDQELDDSKISLRLKGFDLRDQYLLNNLDVKDKSPVFVELSLIQEDDIYAPNFTLENLEEGRESKDNFEITAAKLFSNNLFNYIDIDTDNDIFSIDLKSLDFRKIKNLEEEFDWNNLVNVYLKVNFPNSIFINEANQTIKSFEYQILSNFKIGLDKTIIFNTIDKDGVTYYDSYVHIPVNLNDRQGIVIDN